MVESKVIISGSELTRPTQFSRHFNRFNFDFNPNNNCWKGNLIIFVMTLVSTHSNSWIEIRVSGALGSQPQAKLG